MEKKLKDLLESFNLTNQKTLEIEELLKIIVKNPKFFVENKVTNEFLLEIIDDILVLDQYYLLHSIIPVYTFELDTLKALINKGHIELTELQYLTLNTYFNFDKDFITEYQDNLNWNKIILRKANVAGLVSFNVLEKKKINELNLWDLASSFQLEKKFIKKNRQKLNWEIISITNDFKNEELSDYPELINYKIDDKSVSPFVKVDSIFEDGFLAFDNINDTKDILEKMAAIRKKRYEDIIPNVVSDENKVEIKTEAVSETSNVNNLTNNNKLVEDSKTIEHNILGNTFSQTFTISVGNADPETAKKVLAEIVDNYKQEIKVDENAGEIILDGKIKLPFSKDVLFGQGETDAELPGAVLITDTTSTPLDTFVPIKEEKVSLFDKIINKIKSLFNGK